MATANRPTDMAPTPLSTMDPATTPRTPASTARCNTNRSFRAYRGRDDYPPNGLGFEQSPVRGTTPEGFDSERLELDRFASHTPESTELTHRGGPRVRIPLPPA